MTRNICNCKSLDADWLELCTGGIIVHLGSCVRNKTEIQRLELTMELGRLFPPSKKFMTTMMVTFLCSNVQVNVQSSYRGLIIV